MGSRGRVSALAAFAAALVFALVGFAQAAPGNDAFAAARVLTGTSWSVTGSVAAATTEAGEPAHGVNTWGTTVWFRWTAPASGPVTLDTYGAMTYATFAVYTGSSVSSLTRVVQATLPSGNTSTPWYSATFDAVAGTTYQIGLDGCCGGSGSEYTLTLNGAPPANDNFANAQVLNGDTGSVNGTNVRATREAGEPAPFASEGFSVWYTWTPATTGRVTFRGTGFLYAAMFGVHTGSSLSSLTPVATSSYPHGSVGFDAVAGTTYRIAVGGSSREQKPFTLTWSRTGPPNDSFATPGSMASTVSDVGGSVSGDNRFATKEVGEPAHAGHAGGASVWYRWSNSFDGRISINVAGAGFQPVVAVYTGTAVNALTAVASGAGGTVTFDVVGGTMYSIAVDGSGGATGAFELTWRAVPPANDMFASAAVLGGMSGTASVGMLGATAEPGEPGAESYSNPAAGVWWRWTPTTSGLVSFDFGASRGWSSESPRISLYSGGSTFASLVAVAHEREPSGSSARLTFVFRAGTTYYLRAAGGIRASLSWNVVSGVAPPIPANDNFADARVVSGEVGRLDATNAGATKEVAEPDRLYGGASVWYRWTAPTSGGITFQVPWADGFYAMVNVYEGSTLGGLLSASDSYPSSQAWISARAGTTYYIRVDGTDSGAFALDWRRSQPPPANDAFSASQLIEGESGSVPATNLGATIEPFEPNHAYSLCCSMWFRWTAPSSGSYTFTGEAAEADYAPGFTVYTGDAINALTRVAGSSRSVSFVAAAGVEYRIAVHLAVVWSVSWRPTGLPNDAFATPQPLAGERGSVSGTNADAGVEAGEPSDTGARSVWFTWTAPSTGSVTVDTTGSEFDTVLAVYTGNSFSSLTRVAVNDNSGGLLTSGVSFGAAGGQEYRIAVGSAAGSGGSLRLNWKLAPVGPANDAFASAQTLAGDSGRLTVSNVGAGKEAGEPDHAGRPGGASIWFRWTPSTSGPVRLDTLNSWRDTQLAVYTGASVGALTPIASNDDYAPYWDGASLVRFDAVAGTTYFIALDSWTDETNPAGTVTGAFELAYARRPANDDFAAATPITGAPSSIAGSNVQSTRQPGEPSHFGSYGGGGVSVWYAWTAPADGTATFDATGTAWVPVIAAYTGAALDALTLVAQDDGWARSSTRITFPVVRGTTYRIAIDARYVGPSGPFTLAWTMSAAPNDAWVNAIYLPSGTGHAAASTIGATKEAGEPAHAGEAGGASIWYRLVPVARTRLRITVTSPTFNPVVAVYRGGSVSSLSVVAQGAAPNKNVVDVELEADTLYHIAVDGIGGAQGQIDLTYQRPSAGGPPNDDFAAAQNITSGSSVPASTVGATREPGESDHGGYYGYGSIWYRFTAPADGVYEARSTAGDGSIAAYGNASLREPDVLGTGYTSVRWSAVAGREYRIAVAAAPASFTVSVGPSAVSGPSNDDFADAQTITGWSGVVESTTANATREAGEPHDYWAHDGAGVWYRWTAPGTGVVEFIGESLSPYSGGIYPVAVYSGATVDTLRQITWGGRIAVNAGDVLYVAVTIATFRLTWRQAEEGPAGDRFANAVTLPEFGTLTRRAAELERASREPGEPKDSEVSVWYRWTAPATGKAWFDVVGSETDVGVAVFAGASVGALTLVDDGVRRLGWPFWWDEHVSIDAVAGQTYSLAVYLPLTAEPRSALLTLKWGLEPSNDDFAAAETISGTGGTVTGRTLGATKEAGEPAHSGHPGGASTWYRWTAPASGNVVIDTRGSDFDTLLGVYTGSAVGSLARVHGDDESGGSPQARVVVAAQAGTTYLIAVDGYLADAGLVTLRWHYGPDNDAQASAERLFDRTGRVSGTNSGATKEAGERNHAGDPGGASVWYSWIPGVAGDVVIDTAGSGFDTLLAVYARDTTGTLREVAANDDAGGLRTSEVAFVAEENVEYLIAVDGKGGATGALSLGWSQLAVPPHDLFSQAMPLGAASGRLRDANLFATAEVGEPAHAGVEPTTSVWYRWTAPRGGTATFETSDPYFDSTMAVYTGVTLSSLTLVAANDDKGGNDIYWVMGSRVSFRATAGTTYFIAVDGKNGEVSNFDLIWNAPPLRDAFDPTWTSPFSSVSGAITGTNSWATKERGEPEHAGVAGGASVWISWQAPQTGTATFETTGSDFDTLLAVYTGSSVGALAPVVSNDNNGSTTTSSVTFAATQGTIYRIAVDGRAGAFGDYVLRWRLGDVASAPPNDAFASAGSVPATGTTGTAWSVVGTTAVSSSEPGEPDHGGTGYSVWYRWTAPWTGNLRAQISASQAPSALAVYGGSTLSTLAQLGSAVSDANWFGGYAVVRAVAGTTYFFAVDADGAAHGPHTLSLSLVPIPANDDFASAQAIAGDAGSVSGDNANASREAGEPAGGPRTVWYRWTPSQGGTATFAVTTPGASNRVLRAYTGSSLGSLVRIAPPPLHEGATSVTFRADRGATYWIAVLDYYDWSSVPGGPFTVTWSTLLGDYASGPIPLAGSRGTHRVSTVSATREPGEPEHAGNPGGHSVWFSWRAGSSGRTTFDTAGSPFDTLLAVYTGSDIGSLAQVAANDDTAGTSASAVAFDAVAGTTYLIAVDGYSGASGDVLLNWAGAGPADTTPPSIGLTAPAAGARVARQVTISADAADDVGVARVEFLVNGASLGVDNAAPYSVVWQTTAFADGGATVLARATDAAGNTATSTRSVTIDNTAPTVTVTQRPTSPNELSTATYAFTSNESGSTFECVLDGSAWSPCASPKTYTGVPVGEHRFAVRAIDLAGNVGWEVHESWYQAAPASNNDMFSNARIVTGSSGVTTGTTSTATRESGEPRHAANNRGGRSVWFRWTAPGAGTTTFDTIGSNFDTLLAVYTGTWVGSLTRVASDDDSGGSRTSRLTFTAVAGRTYNIAVDGKNGAYGAYTLRWSGQAGDTTPPDTTVTAGPTGTTTATTASFSFSSSETGSTFECRLDGATWSTCASPRSYSALTDGSHTFDVRAKDAAGNIDPSPAGRTWVVDTTAPDTSITGGPSGTVQTGDATFTFTSPDPAASFECRLDAAAWTACTSPRSFAGLAPGSHTFDVRARDTAGNLDATPATRTWSVAAGPDTTPPDTTITSGPSGTVASASASFAFSSNEAGTTFECALDAAAFTACASPLALATLADGPHTFRVRSRDVAGNVDATPAERAWTVDTTAPDTAITGGPSGTVTTGDASFTFSSADAGATFECRLDAGTWSACTSPRSYTGLAAGSHTFDVRARDAAGNTDASPASRTWTVSAPADTTPPETSITSGPSGTVTSTSATFEFTSTEPGSSFECRLDAAAFAACTSPTSYSALGASSHTFEVRARDAAGNTDATPASRTWTVSAATTSNDMFANGAALSGTSGRATGSSVGATKEAGEPNHGGNAGGKSIWYRWTATASGTLTVDTIGSAFDTTLGIYAGTAVNALTTLGSDDDSGGSLKSKIVLAVTAGTTYSIAVDGYGGASGSVTVNWTLAAATAPANDMFGASQTLVGGSGTVTGTTSGATKETGEPNHAGNAGGKSIWFAWTAPKSGTVTIDTVGSSFDTLLAAYSGSAVGALTHLASNDDASGTQSRISFSASGGVTYRLAVDGYGGKFGAVTLTWSQP